MKKSHCKIGQYYTWYSKDTATVIIKYINNSYEESDHIIGGPRINFLDNTYEVAEGLAVGDRDIRLSSVEERAWLDACIVACELVEKPTAVKSKQLPIFN